MNLLTVPMNIYAIYKKEVKGNEDATLLDVEKKLTRNMKLSKITKRGHKRGKYCQYGKLHFIVSSDNVVVWLKNNCPSPEDWNKNVYHYNSLNRMLKITKETNIKNKIKRDSEKVEDYALCV